MTNHAKIMEEAAVRSERARQSIERIQKRIEAGDPRTPDLRVRLLELEMTATGAEFDRKLAGLRLEAEGKAVRVEVPAAEVGVTGHGG